MVEDMKGVAETLITTHFKMHYDTLLLVARRKIGDFWAEDCVMDVYERCLRYHDRIPMAVALDRFIMAMLLNRIKDYHRDNISYEEVEEYMWESGDLGKQMRARGILKEVMGELDSYAEESRTILYMFLIQGESVATISRICGVNVSAIWVLVHRFRTTIKEKYGIEE